MIHAEKHDICIVSLRIANLQYVKSSCTDSSIVPTNLTFVKTEFGESSIRKKLFRKSSRIKKTNKLLKKS